jgi:hypothetical protein
MTKENFNRLVSFGLVGVAAIVIAPLVFLMIKGVVGLAVAIILVAILDALIPAFSAWLTHLKFSSLKFVISRQPIEELMQRAKERWDALAEQRDLLQQQAASLGLYKKKVEKIEREFPEDGPEARANLSQYEELFAYRVEAFKHAKEETQKFMRTIDRAESIYEMAVAEANMGKSFGKNKDFMAIFREKTAFDAVDKASADSLASLKMALVDEAYSTKVSEPAKAVTYSAGEPVLGSVLSLDNVPIPMQRGAS